MDPPRFSYQNDGLRAAPQEWIDDGDIPPHATPWGPSMNSSGCQLRWKATTIQAPATPIFTPRSIREPTVSQPVMAPFGVAQQPCNSLWTRSVELEDSLGRLAPGAGTFKMKVHLALILMGG